MNCAAYCLISGGEALAMRSRNDDMSSLVFVPLIFKAFRCDASPLMVTVLPGSAKIGIWEKLGKMMVSVMARSHGISKAKRPPSTLMVSKPLMSPSVL